MNIFIICGYGIPKNIAVDDNYRTYLAIIFNTMHELSAKHESIIIPCGGSTKCDPPYDGIESHMIAAYLASLIARDAVREHTALWRMLPEEKSLSTLENLLFAKEIIDQEQAHGTVHIFCEYTRKERLEQFAQHIFLHETVVVHPIDFDISSHRYLDPSVIQTHEALAIKEGLEALKDPKSLAMHHAFFEEKISYLRKRQSEGISHGEALTEWKEKASQHTLSSELCK